MKKLLKSVGAMAMGLVICLGLVGCGGGEVIFKSDFKTGNQNLFDGEGITDGNGFIKLTDPAYTFYNNSTEKNTPMAEKGLTVKLGLKIDTTTLTVGQTFIAVFALNNKSEGTTTAQRFLSEQYVYAKYTAAGVKVAIIDDTNPAVNPGTNPDYLNQAINHSTAATLSNGDYIFEMSVTKGSDNKAEFTLKIKNSSDKTVYSKTNHFGAFKDRVPDSATATWNYDVLFSEIGGLRTLWFYTMDFSQLTLNSLSVEKI